VLVLLPPSEGKTPGGDGPPLGSRPALSTPALAPTRAALVAAVRRAAESEPAALAAGLRLPPGPAAAALAADRSVATAPTRPALDRYAGVVYAGLEAASLAPAARRRADEQVLVLSGVLTVRVLAERGTGADRKVGPVSYHAKGVKGRLTRHLLSSRRRPRTVRQLVAAVTAAAADLQLRVEDRGTRAAPALDLVGRYP
jgi:hypothetical protein